jgi:hypothetical protein
VHVRLPGSEYDRLYELARRDRTSVPALIRALISRRNRVDDGDDEE